MEIPVVEGEHVNTDNVTRGELDDILNALRGEVQGHVDKSTREMQASVTTSFATAIRKVDERNHNRLASIEADVSSTTKQVEKIERENAEMWKAIRTLQHDLVAPEASMPLVTSSRKRNGCHIGGTNGYGIISPGG